MKLSLLFMDSIEILLRGNNLGESVFLWDTLWFIMLLFCIVIAGFNWYFRTLLKRLVREKEYLQQENNRLGYRLQCSDSQRRYLAAQCEKEQRLSRLRDTFLQNVHNRLNQSILDLAAWVRNDAQNLPDTMKYHRHLVDLTQADAKLSAAIHCFVGTQNLKAVEEDVVAFCQELCLFYAHLASKKRLDFSFDAQHESVITSFNCDYLERILSIFLSNAVKFTLSQRRIRVTLKLVTTGALESSLVLTVADSGEGIPKSQLQSIFTGAYRKANITGKRDRGTSLFMAKVLVNRCGGKVFASSEVGVGSTFTVTLPLSTGFVIRKPFRLVLKCRKSDDLLRSSELAADFRGDGRNSVLVIHQDDPGLTARIRQRCPDVQLHETTCGREGLLFALSRKPDLVVTTVVLPEVNGLEICKQLKQHNETRDIAVILLAALPSAAKMMIDPGWGADEVLVRSDGEEKLVNAIRQFLEARRKTAFSIPANRPLSEICGEITCVADRSFIQSAREAVENHIKDPDFDVDGFAREMSMSHTPLYTKIKKLTQYAPVEFIRVIRLEKAIAYLVQQEFTISEISYKVGFNTPSYFAKCFRRHYGKTPKEFLENLPVGSGASTCNSPTTSSWTLRMSGMRIG